MIYEFRNEYFFLSNFFPAAVDFNGITFKNSEAAFQACKVEDFTGRLQFAPLSAKEAKHRGRAVRIRTNWETVKDGYMFLVCKAKFDQHPELQKQLLDTGDQELIEGNWWHDNYWGSCMCDVCDNEVTLGLNKLGNILMSLREAYQLQ